MTFFILSISFNLLKMLEMSISDSILFIAIYFCSENPVLNNNPKEMLLRKYFNYKLKGYLT